MTKKLSILSILLCSLLFLSACSQAPTEEVEKPSSDDTPTLEGIVVAPVTDSDEEAEPAEKAPTPVPAPDPEPEPAETSVKSFTIVAKQFDFSPSTITVNEGDTVRLSINSTDVDHGIAIPEFGVSKVIPGGETVSVEFTASKKGSFGFFCSVFCGSGHGGMKGTVIVQ